MVTARLLGNSGDISNVTPSWCFFNSYLKIQWHFREFQECEGGWHQPPSPRIVMASHFRVTESSPTVFQAQKALRRRLEELKKGGDALGMRQLPGNHREAKVSWIFLLQHELVPTLVWEYSSWIAEMNDDVEGLPAFVMSVGQLDWFVHPTCTWKEEWYHTVHTFFHI